MTSNLIFDFLGDKAYALENRSVYLTTGIRISFTQALQNLTGFLAGAIVSVTIVLFLVGAAYLVASHGKSEMVDKGKKIMIGSLIGMAVVLGAYAILRTVLFLLYSF